MYYADYGKDEDGLNIQEIEEVRKDILARITAHFERPEIKTRNDKITELNRSAENLQKLHDDIVVKCFILGLKAYHDSHGRPPTQVEEIIDTSFQYADDFINRYQESYCNEEHDDLNMDREEYKKLDARYRLLKKIKEQDSEK